MCFTCTGEIFPFNHILEDDEFMYSLQYFHNSVEYNNFLELKFNPYLFEIGIDNNFSCEHLQKIASSNSCNYVFDSNVNISFDAGLSILHLNARSFDKNQDLINVFLSNLNMTFSVIALSETWFKEDQSNLVEIPNYHVVSVPRRDRRSGGSAIYVHNSFQFKIRHDLNLIQVHGDDIDHSESVFVEIISPNSRNIIIGNIYRSHHTDIDSFNRDLSNSLDKISDENKDCYVSGDFNLDLLRYDSVNVVNEFVNNFYSHNMYPLIDRPTRITRDSASILDNIFTNVLNKQIKSGIFVNDITDHYPVFHVTDVLELQNNTPDFTYSRSFNQCNFHCFKNTLELTNWDYVLNDHSPNSTYTNFIAKFTDIYNRCFPVRRKLISKSKGVGHKPWITKAIQKSIKRNDKLYRK